MDEIQTERLRLSPYRADGFDDMTALYGDAAVTAHTLLGQRTRGQVRDILDDYLRVWREAGYGMRTVHRKSDDAFVGECGLFVRPTSGDVALRYALLTRYWGLGFATEAVRATLADAFTAKRLPRVVSVVQAKNLASHRIMEKVGMRVTETARTHTGNLIIYALAREEWLAMAEHPPSGSMA